MNASPQHARPEFDERHQALLTRIDALGRMLMTISPVVLFVAFLAGFLIFSSNATIPGFESVQAVGQLFAALSAVAGGATAAGVLAALGGILRALVVLIARGLD